MTLSLRRLVRPLLLPAFCALLGLGLWAAPSPAQADSGFKNLKILPKDMPKKELKKLMKGMSKSLGVKCKFCHDTANKDYASDKNKHKKIARSMMQMVGKMNAEIFTWEGAPKATCFMCHHGKKEPKMTP